MRQRKPRNIARDLELNAAAIVDSPKSYKGIWLDSFAQEATELHVDLGCGKGEWLAKAASANTQAFYIAFDNNEVCVARTAAKLLESGVSNAKVALLDADDIADVFADGEIDRLHLNFNSPFPKKKYAWKRLTHLDRLMEYRSLLGPEGILDLRTDHDPYWQFTLLELDLAGYKIVRRTDDLRANSEGFDDIASEYEHLTVARGAVVHALLSKPGEEPAVRPQQTAPLDLVAYLPDDLSKLERIPYGMEDTVVNLTNRAANRARRLNR